MLPKDNSVTERVTEPATEPAPPVIAVGITPERLAATLHAAGYRASVTELNGIFEVRSASQGLNFFARFGNPCGSPRQFFDFTFYCPLAVSGELSPNLTDLWNRTRRFARLNRDQHLLMLSMDVLAAGGVPDTYVRAQCEVWEGMIRDLLLYLRQNGTHAPAHAAADTAPTKPAGEAQH